MQWALISMRAGRPRPTKSVTRRTRGLRSSTALWATYGKLATANLCDQIYLCQEAFASEDGYSRIPARILRERLSRTLELAAERERVVYGETDPEKMKPLPKSFRDFVELCEQKEQETGVPVTILASY